VVVQGLEEVIVRNATGGRVWGGRGATSPASARCRPAPPRLRAAQAVGREGQAAAGSAPRQWHSMRAVAGAVAGACGRSSAWLRWGVCPGACVCGSRAHTTTNTCPPCARRASRQLERTPPSPPPPFLSEIYSVLDRGTSKRRTAETLLNKTSSRSHRCGRGRGGRGDRRGRLGDETRGCPKPQKAAAAAKPATQ
jgi:hypothetical protein